MSSAAEKLITEAVREALSGIMSEHRAAARAAKQHSVRVNIPLVEIHRRVKTRLDGLRKAVKVPRTPSVAKLREKWLPMIIAGWENAALKNDVLELVVDVPSSRKAHAR